MLNKYFYVVAIITFLLRDVAGERKKFKTLLFQQVQTDFVPDYTGNYSVQISKNHLSLDMILHFIKDLPVDTWLKVAILFREPKSGNYRGIFAYDVNICNLIGKDQNSFNIVSMWMKNLLKYSNLPKSCPIKEDVYFFRKLRPEKETIPAFFLTGRYRINTEFYLRDLNNAQLTNTSMMVDIKMK